MKSNKAHKFRITQEDFLLANRKASREEEIFLHGKPVSGRRLLHRSKKQYSRKNRKPICPDD